MAGIFKYFVYSTLFKSYTKLCEEGTNPPILQEKNKTPRNKPKDALLPRATSSRGSRT